MLRPDQDQYPISQMLHPDQDQYPISQMMRPDQDQYPISQMMRPDQDRIFLYIFFLSETSYILHLLKLTNLLLSDN